MTDLNGVEAKIERAKAHLADFKTCFANAIDAQPQTFRLEPDDDPDWSVLRVDGVPEVDPAWSLIVGDCIHNIRAALDHLFYQIVLLDGGTPDTQTAFPIRLSGTDKNGTWVGPRPQPAIQCPDLLDVLDEVQPYNAVKTFFGPNATVDQDWLGVIHRLDIIDKHRLILVAVITPDMNDLSWATHSALAGQTFEVYRQPLKDGSPVARFPFRWPPPDDFDPHPALRVALNETDTRSLGLWHLPFALGHMIDYVERFVIGQPGIVQHGFRRFFP